MFKEKISYLHYTYCTYVVEELPIVMHRCALSQSPKVYK